LIKYYKNYIKGYAKRFFSFVWINKEGCKF
jgi:hypothetical protein